MPDDIVFLWLLRIFAGGAALAYGLIATYTDLREEKDGERQLTAKGKAGFAIAFAAFFLSISADLFKDRNEERARARAESEFRARIDSMTAKQAAVLAQIAGVRSENVATLTLQRASLGHLDSVLDASRFVSQQQFQTLALSTQANERLDSAQQQIESSRIEMLASVARGTNPVTTIATSATITLDPNDTFLPGFLQRASMHRSREEAEGVAPYGLVVARYTFWRSDSGCAAPPAEPFLTGYSGLTVHERADSSRFRPTVMYVDSTVYLRLVRALLTGNEIVLDPSALRLAPHARIAIQDLQGACVGVKFFWTDASEEGPPRTEDLRIAWERAAVRIGPFDFAPGWRAPSVAANYHAPTGTWVGRLADVFRVNHEGWVKN